MCTKIAGTEDIDKAYSLRTIPGGGKRMLLIGIQQLRLHGIGQALT